MPPPSDRLPERTRRALQELGVADDARLCIAFSGGLDSTVLLHALTMLRAASPMRIRAVHIDHRLHPDSAQWSAHCEAVCAGLGVPFEIRAVEVDRGPEGLEAAARRVRYEALAAALAPGEILLTAHHADDQLETVLLALVRGAGVRGLSGVAASQSFGAGRLIRPLLAFSRSELYVWAQARGLVWLEDPSNANVDLDRNYLRSRVLPVLRERWPAAARGAGRSAAHLAEARALLAEAAARDLASLREGEGLSVRGLLDLGSPRRRAVLREWFAERGVHSPSTAKLRAIEQNLLAAGVDRNPCVMWDETALRRYDGVLYLEQQALPFDASAVLTWDVRTRLKLPQDLGVLRLAPGATGDLDADKLGEFLLVRFRSGGEILRPAGDAHHRALKKLLQSARIPPWRRTRAPLVYAGDRLVAVGDLWIAEDFVATADERAVRVVWEKDSGGSRE